MWCRNLTARDWLQKNRRHIRRRSSALLIAPLQRQQLLRRRFARRSNGNYSTAATCPHGAKRTSACKNFLNAAQGRGDGLPAHGFTVTGKMEQFRLRVAATALPADPHGAYR